MWFEKEHLVNGRMATWRTGLAWLAMSMGLEFVLIC